MGMIDMIVNFSSVALTLPTLVLAFFVLLRWAPKTCEVWRSGGPKSGVDWLLTGVTASFVGVFLNSFYAGAYYLAAFMEQPKLAGRVLEFGPVMNIGTRLIPFIIAAYCHLQAFAIYAPREGRSPKPILIASMIAGFVLLGILSLVAPKAR